MPYSTKSARLLALITSLLLLPAVEPLAHAEDGKPIAILLAVGDISKCGPAGADEKTASLLTDEIAKAKSESIPVAVLALGDLAYDNGTKADFTCYNQSWGQDSIYSVTLPIPGNHEYQTDNAKPYFNYFSNLPIVADNAKRGGYYAVDFLDNGRDSWRIYALNSYAGVGSNSPQIHWLTDDLAKAKAPCILAFWHPFLFSSGHHGHAHSKDAKAPFVRGKTMVAAFEVLRLAGASTILSGHDHDFEQFGRHDVDGNADSDGLRSFVVGTGGGPLYNTITYKNRPPTSEFYQQDTHGVLRLELFSSSYRWTFVVVAGAEPISLKPNEDDCRSRPL
ncbi:MULTISPECIES: metallophosphoesterase family protein [Rhizobium]|uniref:metallophosphoesterase family protein n=1 Tax=Rhizobium TaxID=379 RepID=UPI00103276EC|nr:MULTISPECIES: metallophosphoesterase [Rhizobium]TBF24876.1 hypothetical protein ELG88_33760 [Rhizobium leguminosarum]WSH48591.1 metallophosphoesterase [Rhizobium johnstonii]